MTEYALAPAVFEALQRAARAPTAPTAEQCQEFIDAHAADSNLGVNAGVAQINVHGILSKRPSFLAWLMGGSVTYESLSRDLQSAASDPAVKSVLLDIDSPGGEVAGLFELVSQIQAFPKPIRTRASSALSAAYAIASATNSITAVHESSTFGSVGVATALYNDNRVIHLASTDAPKKRPNPATDEGQAVVREHLDALHGLLADAIATGRKTTAQKVNSDFGRGAVVLAGAAKSKGMIDSIASAPAKKTTSATAQRTTMKFSLSDLKSTNPSLHQQFTEICGENAEALFREIASDGYAEGYNEVLMAERARCVQHVECAARAGDPMFAFDAVESGAPFDADAVAGYTTRGAALPQYRGGMLVSAGTPVAGVPDVGDLVVAEMLRRRGRIAEADAVAPAPAPALALATTPRKMTDAELQKEIVELMAQRGKGR